MQIYAHQSRLNGGAGTAKRELLLACSLATLTIAITQSAAAQGTGSQSAAQLPPVSVEAPRQKAAPRAASKSAPVQRAAPVAVPSAPVPARQTFQAQAGRPAGPASDTPLATQTTGQEIRQNEISNFTDLGNTTEPGVEYNKNTDGPNIRGMDGARIVTTIDGIPLPYVDNAARTGAQSAAALINANGGSAAFDFNSISVLDVVRGADASRLGPGAMGGAIVLRTLEPEDLIEAGKNLGGVVKGTYDSRDTSYTGALALAGRAGGWSVLVQGSDKSGHETINKGQSGWYGLRRTDPNPGDLDQDNVLFKVRLTGNSGHRIGFTAERFRTEGDYDLLTVWGRSTAGSGFRPGNIVGQESTERRRTSFEYSYVSPVAGAVINTAFATAYSLDMSRQSGTFGRRNDGDVHVRDNGLNYDGLGFVSGATGYFQTGGLRHKWTAGTDFADFTQTQYTDFRPANMFAGLAQADIPKIEGQKFGVYIDDRISWAGSRFALTPGIRFDWHEYTPVATAQFQANQGIGLFPMSTKVHSGSGVAPKLLGTYQLADQIELFAQWSATYRAPTPDELYSNFTNPITGYAQVGNPNLKSETGQAVEVGANLGDRSFGGRIAAYHNSYKNFIIASDFVQEAAFPGLGTGVARYKNLPEAQISGFEVKAHRRFANGFIVHGALVYANGTDQDGALLPTIAPMKGVVGIGYEASNWGVDLTGIFVASYHDSYINRTISPSRDDTFDAPSYKIANLSTWWEPAGWKGMRIQGMVRNLFDETYYDALSLRNVVPNNGSALNNYQPIDFYSSPGRNFVISATQKF